MKTYYVRLAAHTYQECLIEAENEIEALQIANNLDANDTYQEIEDGDIEQFVEITEISDHYDVPILQQTKEGYKVKQ